MQNRINKLKSSKDSNKKIVTLKFLLTSVSIILIYSLSLIWSIINKSSSGTIVEIAYNLCRISYGIKISDFLFFEIISRREILINKIDS